MTFCENVGYDTKDENGNRTDYVGRELPTPVQVAIHRHGVDSTYGGRFDLSVVEQVHAMSNTRSRKSLCVLIGQVGTCTPDKSSRWAEHLLAMFISHLVAQRMREGWTLLSVSDSSAYLSQ